MYSVPIQMLLTILIWFWLHTIYHLLSFIQIVKSHGNSKSGVPFHPTWSSTKEIRDKCATEGPKSVVASLSASIGGVLQASALGSSLVMRSKLQISDPGYQQNKERQIALLV